jgi:hypothetical protein
MMNNDFSICFGFFLNVAWCQKKKTEANGEILSFKWCKTRVKLHFGNGEEKDFQGEFFISFCSVFT